MLDAQKMREIRAIAPGLEIEESSWPTYQRLVILRALEFFQELQEAGGLGRFIQMADGAAAQEPREPAEPAPRIRSATVETYSNSEFLLAVSGKDSAEAWAVMDGLMNSLKHSNVKAYDNVMRKIREL